MKIILLCLLGFQFSALAQSVFSVGATKVSVEDFKKRLKEYRDTTYNAPTPDQLLEDWIRFEVGVQEAEKEKLKDDAVVKERFRQVLYNALLEKALAKKIDAIPVTESDMQAYYKHNPEIRLSHIFIEYPQNATDAQRKAAHDRATEIAGEVKKALKSGRKFEDLVKLYTDDLATKNTGGDMDYQSRVTLVPPSLYESAIKLREGEIAGPVESRQGFHILKMTGKHSYEDADKRQIRAAVFDEKRAKIFADYFDKLKKNYTINVDKKAFKAAVDSQ